MSFINWHVNRELIGLMGNMEGLYLAKNDIMEGKEYTNIVQTINKTINCVSKHIQNINPQPLPYQLPFISTQTPLQNKYHRTWNE
jgi:uncharacterized protein involved in tolerance to divalent cations